MTLTRNFNGTLLVRMRTDRKFAQELLSEAATLFLNGEADTAKLILRDLVNATVGFKRLAKKVHKPSKNIHRMLSKSGNPTMQSLSEIFAAIRKALKVKLEVRTIYSSVFIKEQ